MRFTVRPSVNEPAAAMAVMVMAVMDNLLSFEPADILTLRIRATILSNRNRLCGFRDNGCGPQGSLRLRNGRASPWLSRRRAAQRRLGFEPQRGGAAARGEARRAAPESHHAQHRPDRSGRPSA